MSKDYVLTSTPVDDSYEAWVVVFPDYHPGFLDEFKEKVPKSARNWDPQEKVWTISGDYIQKVYDLAAKYFPGVKIVEEEV